jgi:uncharacterized membrane protein
MLLDLISRAFRGSIINPNIFSASLHDSYGLYSDLEAHPAWSPWLRRVSMDKATRESEWELQSKGIKVTWKAKNTIEVSP